MLTRKEVFVLISEHTNAEDIKNTYGVQPNEIIKFPKETRFPELLCELGIFKSRSDARKNGWNKDIPLGYHHLTIGKLKHSIEMLKTTDMDDKINHLMKHDPLDIFIRGLYLLQDFKHIINLLESEKFDEAKNMISHVKNSSIKESEEFWKDYIGFEQ